MMGSNYLLLSTSAQLTDRKIASLLYENGFLDATITYYDLETDSLADVLEDVDTVSFLTPKKAVIAKNALFLEAGGKEEEKVLQHLEKYLEHPLDSVLCIFTVRKLDERKKISKRMKEKTTFLDLNQNLAKQQQDLFQGYKLEKGVLSLLQSYCQDDFDTFFMESEKLKLYRFEEKEIFLADVKLLVQEPLQDKDNLAFQLSRSIAERNKKEALSIYQQLAQYRVEPHAMLGLMESQYRLLYQVKVLEKQGFRKEEIAQTLEAHPFRISKTMELTRLYSLPDIQKFLLSLANLDYQMKSGEVDSTIAIELLILNQ